MVAVEEILWNIFTFYTLNGNPKDPSRMHNTALVRFCRDIMVMDSSMTEAALNHADLQLIYTAATKSPEKASSSSSREKSDKIDFDAFLTCLIRISQKCYPSGRNKEETMQQLLLDNILPMASRRKPISIAALVKQPHIELIYKYYEDALIELFKFYTTSSDLNKKGRTMMYSTSHLADTFDGQRAIIEEAKGRVQRGAADPNHSNRMGYHDFIRFANDFGLVTSLGVTTLDLGDIYLTVLYYSNFTPSVRRIELREFWEVLIRCALVAFQDKKSLTTETKIKALFLAIWRHIQSSVKDHMNGYGQIQGGGFGAYKGALLRGTQILNDKFIAAWTKDEYRDYLAPMIAPDPVKAGGKALAASTKLQSSFGAPPPPPPPTSTLTRLLKGDGAHEAGKSRARSSSNATAGMKSPSGRAATASMDNTEQPDGEIDALTEDKLLHIGHNKVAQSDNFLIKLPEGALMRIKISDDAELNDRRINIGELRKLMFDNPSIAGLLYEAMIECNIVHPDVHDEDGDDFDQMGKETDIEASMRSMSMDMGRNLSMKDLISNNTPMFGNDNKDHNDSDIGIPIRREVSATGDMEEEDFEDVHSLNINDDLDFTFE